MKNAQIIIMKALMEVAGRDLSNIVALTHKLGLGSE